VLKLHFLYIKYIHRTRYMTKYFLSARILNQSRSMASHCATWVAFGTLFRRGLTTTTTTRSSPRRLTNLRLPPHHHFTSNRTLRQDGQNSYNDRQQQAKPVKRKAARTQAGSNSLRRVAVEAQRSRKLIEGRGKRRHVNPEIETKDVTAYCAAETYRIHVARQLLQQEGYQPDPFSTDLFPQVLHVQTPNYLVKDARTGDERPQGVGDVFVFPSGSVVTWNVPENVAHSIVERILPHAAENGHLDKLEAEDLEYLEDPTRDTSKIVGDTIILGTRPPAFVDKQQQQQPDLDTPPPTTRQELEVDTILAKIAFSSALARSTKLAVLENSLNQYFATTRSIPTTLSHGKPLSFTRAFILRKTGELLSIRAQLNLYSELTDSLPDLFWDSPHELGLEGYYEQVGAALDVGVRIKILNEKMDYAVEIAAVLRERLSEKHSTGLEWMIIVLIMIEVGFGVVHLWQEGSERRDPDSTRALLREYLERELGKG